MDAIIFADVLTLPPLPPRICFFRSPPPLTSSIHLQLFDQLIFEPFEELQREQLGSGNGTGLCSRLIVLEAIDE